MRAKKIRARVLYYPIIVVADGTGRAGLTSKSFNLRTWALIFTLRNNLSLHTQGERERE